MHLYSNLLLIILLGGALEKKYGHAKMLFMILITAFVTGIANAAIPFFSGYILGASGIAFMFIALTPSLLDKDDGKIPIEYLLVVLLFGGREIYAAFHEDQISQLAHLIGGACGLLFGLLYSKLDSINLKGEQAWKISER
jgi:membrane associated rhomboid family serine protease